MVTGHSFTIILCIFINSIYFSKNMLLFKLFIFYRPFFVCSCFKKQCDRRRFSVHSIYKQILIFSFFFLFYIFHYIKKNSQCSWKAWHFEPVVANYYFPLLLFFRKKKRYLLRILEKILKSVKIKYLINHTPQPFKWF